MSMEETGVPFDNVDSGSHVENMGIPDFDGLKLRDFSTSIPKTEKALTYKAIGQPDVKGETLIGKEIGITHYLVQRIEIMGKNEEMISCLRTVLMDDKGKTVGFTSDSVISGIENAIKIFGPAPWKPSLRFILKQFPTRSGGRAYNFEPIF